jgi:hypothetical protein
MRLPNRNDFATINADLAKLQAQAAVLEDESDKLNATLQDALAAPDHDFDEHTAVRLRREHAALQERRGLLADRIAATRRRLPADDARAAAAAQAHQVAADAATALQRVARATLDLAGGLAGLEPVAQELIAARADAGRAVARLEEANGRFGLDVHVPKAEPVDTKLPRLLGIFVAQALDGEPDEVVLRDLAALRRRHAS